VPSSEISNKLPWYLLVLPPSILSWVMRRTYPKVDRPLSRERLQENTGEKTRSLFSNILEDGDEYSRLSDEIIVREAKAFIVAGTDTTAITATYLIWQVLKHPEVKTRLQRELHEIDGHVSIVGVQRLRYLQCVINETLRLNGAVSSSLPRVTPKGGKEIGGYFIPEDTLVSTQAWTLHRNSEVFEDPLAFKPERWEFPTMEMRGSFMPFGIGSRGESANGKETSC
jgi:cytochrome P450